MSDSPPSRTNTSTDYESDENVTFTEALYARIHRQPSGEYVQNRPIQMESISLLDHDEADALHMSATLNEHNMRPVSKNTLAPPAFVARVRNRLQNELNMCNIKEADIASVGSNTCNICDDGKEDNDGKEDTTERAGNSMTFQSVLNRIETELSEQYGRVLMDEFPLLENETSLNNGDSNSTWRVDLHKAVPSTIDTWFHDKYKMTVDDFLTLTNGLVDDVVNGYANYFSTEKEILAVAEHYDALQDWVCKSKTLFTNNNQIKPQMKLFLSTFDTMMKQHSEMDTLTVYDDGDDDNDDNQDCADIWSTKIQKSKNAWLDIQSKRVFIERLRGIVGGHCTCKICFDATIQTALVPCGHTLCKQCAEQVGQCPFCNATFYSVQNIFLG